MKKIKRVLSVIFCTVLFTGLFAMAVPATAYADIGPKPSVTITIEGLTGDYADVKYYGTLLSLHDSTGPASAYDGNNMSYYGEDVEIWQRFVDYVDADGFWYLQEDWSCQGNDSFKWGYYPPSTFKVLLYFPEYDSFISTGIYERYAFDTYYEVDLTGIDISKGASIENTHVHRNYDYTWEIISLAARAVLTIILELLIAVLIFRYREKRTILCFAYINVITQIGLNIALNIINYNKGSWGFVFWYIVFEAAVFILEAALYTIIIHRKDNSVSKEKLVLYAFIANVISLLAGIAIAHAVPGIF